MQLIVSGIARNTNMFTTSKQVKQKSKNFIRKKRGAETMKQTITFAVTTKDGVITGIGKSTIAHPPIKYDGRKTKWFDDFKMLKKDIRHRYQ